MNKPTLKEQAHGEIEKIFRILLPQNGLSVREEQITLCHAMLDTLLKNNIALCDAGVGIGKTYAYLTACILLKKFAPHGPAGSQPVVISTSSVALQDSIIEEYIPFLSRIFLENRVISKPIRAIVRKGKERFVCDARLSQRLEAVKDKNKNAKQLKALLSLRTYYDLDSVTGLSGFDRRQVCVPKVCEKTCPLRSACRYHQYRDLNEYADFIDNTRLILTILDSPMPVFSSSVFRNIVSRITVTHETLRFQLVNGLELEEERISGG